MYRINKSLSVLSYKKLLVLFSALLFCFSVVCVFGCSSEGTDDGSSESVSQSDEDASQSDEDESSGEPVELENFVWATDTDCNICHIQEEESMQNPECPASLHSDQECIVCHDDEAGLADVHKKVKTTEDPEKGRLWTTEINELICADCHDKAELIQLTASNDNLKDSEGTIVNPHDVPENASHATITCSSCHKMHQANDVGAESRRLCIGCHHQDVWECGSCHAYDTTNLEQ